MTKRDTHSAFTFAVAWNAGPFHRLAFEGQQWEEGIRHCRALFMEAALWVDRTLTDALGSLRMCVSIALMTAYLIFMLC